jgi:hypothetical protein
MRPVNRRSRIAGASVALLLHGAAFLALVRLAVPEQTDPVPVFSILVVPQPQPRREEMPPPAIAPQATESPILPAIPELPRVPTISLPPGFAVSPPPQSTLPSLAGIGRVMFGCTPEQLAALSAAERLRCQSAGLAQPPDEASLAALAAFDAVEHAYFDRELKRKQGPVLLPCMNPNGIGVTIWTVYCVADGVINGFDVDSEKYAIYEPRPDEPVVGSHIDYIRIPSLGPALPLLLGE